MIKKIKSRIVIILVVACVSLEFAGLTKLYIDGNLKVLEPAVYSVQSVNLPENGHELLRDEILKGRQATLPVESVMAGDGSAWKVDLNLPVDWRCLNITNRSYGFRPMV